MHVKTRVKTADMPTVCPSSTALVILFAYFRLEHTQRTVEALSINILADQTSLIVYSNAIRDRIDTPAAAPVRSFWILFQALPNCHMQANLSHGC